MVDSTHPIVVGTAVEPVEGQDSILQLIVATGNVLPFPDDSGQPIVLRTGVERFYLPRELAEKTAEMLNKVSEGLRKQSSIPVATNMNEVEEAAKRLQDLQNGR